MSGPRVRRARPADLDALVRLERVSFPREDWFPRHRFRRWFERPGVRIWVAALPGAVVAGNAVVLFRAGSGVARLYNLVVDPEHRRAGLAAALLRRAQEDAAARGCHRMVLEVREGNTPAVAFYRRAGFTGTERRPGYYPDGEAALRMALDLPAARVTDRR